MPATTLLGSLMTRRATRWEMGSIPTPGMERALILLLTTPVVLCQAAESSKLGSVPDQPKALVQSLYDQVVARHPLGISIGADNMRVFAPCLSKTLPGAPCLAGFETWESRTDGWPRFLVSSESPRKWGAVLRATCRVPHSRGFRDPSTPLRAGHGNHEPTRFRCSLVTDS
jgi:hypothetical protein